jgi:EpsI family protein
LTPAVRLGLVLCALLVPVGARHWISVRAERVANFDLGNLPAQLGPLALEGEQELPPDVLAMIQPDAHSLRLYADRNGGAVWAYLGFYSGTGAKSAHDPEVCYPAQGWDIAALHSREVRLADGKSLTGKLLAASLGGQEELVLYWFQPVGRWPKPSPEELALRGIDALAGRSRYAFVRLSTRISAADVAQQTAAEARLVDAARALAPAVRAAVDAG